MKDGRCAKKCPPYPGFCEWVEDDIPCEEPAVMYVWIKFPGGCVTADRCKDHSEEMMSEIPTCHVQEGAHYFK